MITGPQAVLRWSARFALATCCWLLLVGFAHAQSASCTSVAVGATQDITAFGVCKKVTLNSVPAPATGVAGICVPTNIDAAQWASFYNNPPTGVTIAECTGGCTGYSYGGYCFYYSGDLVQQSCDTTCASYGGCNAAGTRYIGSDDPGSTRCGAVATALTGTAITASAAGGAGPGCYYNTFKGGYLAFNYYSPTTVCSDATVGGRVCACNATGGTASCNLPWGGTIAHGASVTAHNEPFGYPCESETRTCNNGVLSGSYNEQNCSNHCTAPWGTMVQHNTAVTAYAAALGSPNCTSQIRSCTNGVLSGTYANQTCAAGCAANQTVNWTISSSSCTALSGAVLTSGSGRTISDSTAPTTGTRNISCSNGTLSNSGGTCTTASTCGGYSYLGYCYYLGGTQSCDTICASYGGCNSAGMDRIGVNGTNAECQNVADTLGMFYNLGPSQTATGWGCYAQIGGRGQVRLWRSTTAASCSTTITGTNRICACNN